ncbi:aspartyl-phosphate phosphatase Spo0E family protein [Paenibacillus sp. M1]|uniref:Aspartyl-phosphate phosphatase Spo0E family protein n=1 Tax=Paenibacillus haidiansis TaxID=1574488 RepID=A0ABU7VWD6_9BACL
MNGFTDIKLKELQVGRDLLLVITGGAAHIGAASTAYNVNGAIEVQTSAVPGHKEHTLTEGLARRAAEELRRTVTVVMGIHYDHLSKEEILFISQQIDKLLEQYIAANRMGDAL